MVALADIRHHRDAILALARKHGAHDVRLFGSVARGDTTPASDVDFLVAFDAGRTLLDLVALQLALRDLLHREVDIVTEAGLKDRIRPRILAEAVPL